MTPHPKIPAGWRRLRTGESLLTTDKYFSVFSRRWELAPDVGGSFMPNPLKFGATCIRRITKKKGRK